MFAMSLNGELDRTSLDFLLNELAKILKSAYGRRAQPMEIILVGGAAIIVNHQFRYSTQDVDAWLFSEQMLGQSIRQVGERFGLSHHWLNQDFVKTSSFSQKLREVSAHYKTFQRILEVRVIQGSDLIAMKLIAGRKYKNDLSDIVGVLMEYEEQQRPISLDQINQSLLTLYGQSEFPDAELMHWLKQLMQHGSYRKVYDQVRREEANNQSVVIEAIEQGPSIFNESDVDAMLALIRERKDK